MKTISELNLKALSAEELLFTQGGSEFSKSVFFSIGWVAGAVTAMWESFITNQERMYKNGLHPAL